jgi:hypothetical protein
MTCEAPQGRRIGDGPLTPVTMTNSSTLETRAMAEQPRAANERWHDTGHSHGHDAPLPERVGCLAADADVIRMTQPLAAA